MNTLIRIISRPMLASVFLRDGIDAVVNPDDHVKRFKKVEPLLEKAGLPPVLTSDAKLLARLSGLMTATAALCFSMGKAPRFCALILALINFFITFVNNPVWNGQSKEEKNTLYRGLIIGTALTGGLGMAILDTKGKPSRKWRRAIENKNNSNI